MTAKDLLYKVLDYKFLWSSPKNCDSLPARTRLRQIESLLDAFGLSKKYVNPLVQVKYFVSNDKVGLDRAHRLNNITNLEYLIKGEFLKDRPYENNIALNEKTLQTIKELFPDYPDDIIRSKPGDINWLFNNLLLYRQEIYKVTYPSGGMLEGFSVGLHYSKHLQNKLNKIIKDNLEDIDETLWLILDPSKKQIDKEILIRDYNYIDQDLDKIDLEWRTQNY